MPPGAVPAYLLPPGDNRYPHCCSSSPSLLGTVGRLPQKRPLWGRDVLWSLCRCRCLNTAGAFTHRSSLLCAGRMQHSAPSRLGAQRLNSLSCWFVNRGGLPAPPEPAHIPRELRSGVSAAGEESGALGRVGEQGVRAHVRCHQTIQAGNRLRAGEVRVVPPVLRGRGNGFSRGWGEKNPASSSKGCG